MYFGTHGFSHSVFTRTQRPNVNHPSSFDSVAARFCEWKGHCSICHSPCMTDHVKETTLVLAWMIIKQNYFFLIATWIFFSECRLEFDVCFIKHCNFVAHDKGQPNIFDKSVASAFFCLLNLFWKPQASRDLSLVTHEWAASFCILRHYQFCFPDFQCLKQSCLWNCLKNEANFWLTYAGRHMV